MARKKKKKSQKHSLTPDYRRLEQDKLVRRYRKTILFNEKELSLINQYCEKFSVRNRSAFMREAVIAHILGQLDENYPRLFWQKHLFFEKSRKNVCFVKIMATFAVPFGKWVVWQSCCGAKSQKNFENFENKFADSKKGFTFAVPFGKRVLT